MQSTQIPGTTSVRLGPYHSTAWPKPNGSTQTLHTLAAGYGAGRLKGGMSIHGIFQGAAPDSVIDSGGTTSE